ncbi:hypothetical protein D9619_008185 [Psilocybe cf. subviscida]|uniref:Secreted protein n=1 Tax=Psilocybe cf. subviscida TaxID=2480587 RepID=A0A8H5AU08_9AGAR|nr:hypothetical protein D9619_008185 [Psilocybe cf. subviscida]
MSWTLCLVAIVLGTSHSFAVQRVVPVYVFTVPATVMSVGTCRNIIRVEKERDPRANFTKAINTAEGNYKGKRLVDEDQSRGDAPPTQNKRRHSYRPRPAAAIPSPSDPEASESSLQRFSSELRRLDLDTVVSNFPYLHGAQSYISKLKRNRGSMVTAIANSATNYSPQSSSNPGSLHIASIWTASDSGPSLCATYAVKPEATDARDQHDMMEQTTSASNIQIGSQHSSSSVNSAELRQFYNHMWNAGSFMTGGP